MRFAGLKTYIVLIMQLVPTIKMERDLRDFYPWCHENGMYIPQEALVDMIRHQKPHLVLDARDDDHIGGNIFGSLHAPDSEWERHLPSVIDRIKALREETGVEISDITVVFHCMESARRGPRCAYKLTQYFEDLGIVSPTIKVLEGGAHNWIHKYFADPTLVENFDDDYWGILPLDVEAGTEEQFHKDYSRPPDQPATSWSKAGGAV